MEGVLLLGSSGGEGASRAVVLFSATAVRTTLRGRRDNYFRTSGLGRNNAAPAALKLAEAEQEQARVGRAAGG